MPRTSREISRAIGEDEVKEGAFVDDGIDGGKVDDDVEGPQEEFWGGNNVVPKGGNNVVPKEGINLDLLEVLVEVVLEVVPRVKGREVAFLVDLDQNVGEEADDGEVDPVDPDPPEAVGKRIIFPVNRFFQFARSSGPTVRVVPEGIVGRNEEVS